MIEKDVVYSNPVRIDDDAMELDKKSKIVVSMVSLLDRKESYGLVLAEVDKILDVLKDL